MLKIYRRHAETCPYKQEGRAHIRCTCPIWVDGTLPDVASRVNCAMDTRNWQIATRRMQEWESEGAIVEDTRVEIAAACEAFRADGEARNLADATLKKYRVVLEQLQQFCEAMGIDFIQQIDTALARKFRESWKDQPLSASKKLERLRQFFKFAVDSGWIVKSPAASIRAPKIPDNETQPFTREEMTRILAAAARMQEAAKVRAFVLLQRYSGLRIGDCASLEKDRIDPLGRLFLYTAKSRTPVRLPLPSIVVESLNAFKHIGKAHYFWTGYSSLDTLTSNWRRTMRRLFELAELPGGHAHRFRDTFAVELLLAGTPIEEVSRLLGHRSIRVTEKHYSAWVRSRQERAEALVKTSWESDPLLNPAATAATKLLQEAKGA